MVRGDLARSRVHVARSATVCVLFATLWGLPSQVAASNVTVGCPGSPGGPYDYSSLASALTTLRGISPGDHTVTVSGTCTEFVNVYGMKGLRIVGTPGAMIVEPPGPLGTSYGVLTIGDSSNVTIAGLTLQGGDARRTLLHISGSTAVELLNCVLEKSDHGIYIHSLAHARIHGTTIQNIRLDAIRVDGNSEVQVGEPQNEQAHNVIQQNGTGILAREDGVAMVSGATVIQENGTGISGQGGTVSFCCGNYEIDVINNGMGFWMLPGSKLLIQGVTRIEGNSGGGIWLLGSDARLLGQYTIRGNGPTGISLGNGGNIRLEGSATIEDHTQTGISLTGSTAYLSGHITVQHNGTPNQALNGGIVVAFGSQISMYAGPITGNQGPGILVTHNSTARVSLASVTGNGGEGVRVQALSSVWLFGGNTIAGNTAFDLSCAPNSYGSGDHSGIGRMFCPTFDRSPTPGSPVER
jgi:hypothetical protein